MEKDILLPEKKRKKVRKELEKRFLKFDREKYLKLGSLLDEEKNSIICPFCFNPSVKYLKKYEEWCCEYCGVEIKFPSIIHEINIEDKEMYKINTLWGIKALQKLTGKDLSFLYLKLYGEKYLDLGNFLDEEKNSLICPFCFNPSAKYIEKYKEWYCGHCDVEIKFESISFKLDIDNKEMYKIYKLWGIDALQKLTGKTIAALQKQVGKYFENCCSSRGDEK